MAQRKFGSSRDTLRYEPGDRRVRARLGGVTVADTVTPTLVWEAGRYVATYAVPRDAVAGHALRPAATARDGAAETWDVVADGRHAPAAAWRYDDPDLAGLVVLDFAALDAWLEEDEELFSHPQDPFHRVTTRPSSRHVSVDVAGVRLAESTRPVLLFETNFPPRAYLDPADVRTDLLTPSETETRCPYKGIASYFSVTVDGTPHADVVWTYADPLPESEPVRGLLCFWPGRAEVRVDGELSD